MKTQQFGKERYLGDPINVLRIFNHKYVDEIAILDITASQEQREPNFAFLEELAGECFMPLAYGGGISNLQQARRILQMGFERVILNRLALSQPETLKQFVEELGSSSIIVCLDIKKPLFGSHRVYTDRGTKRFDEDLAECIAKLEALGVGEIIIQSIDRDGMMNGYDLDLIKKVRENCRTPFIALGGAGNLSDLREAWAHGASGSAAGSLFVFKGPRRAVLISYPNDLERQQSLEGSPQRAE